MKTNISIIRLQHNVERLMLKRKLRMIPLATKAKVSKGLLWKLMTDKGANPTLDTLDKLADALGVETQELLWA